MACELQISSFLCFCEVSQLPIVDRICQVLHIFLVEGLPIKNLHVESQKIQELIMLRTKSSKRFSISSNEIASSD